MNNQMMAKIGPGSVPTTATAAPPDPKFFPQKTSLDDKADVRDILANFVGRGDKDLKGDQALKDYHYLAAKLGQPMAQKMITHVISFNQRPDQQNQPFDKKLTSFYSMGSNDKDVDKVLKTSNALGEGPIGGAQQSTNADNMTSTGRMILPSGRAFSGDKKSVSHIFNNSMMNMSK